MELDLNTYMVNKKPFQRYYHKNKDRNDSISNMISIWSSSTFCPCIVLAFYLAEDIGYTAEIIRLIDIFVRTYEYKLILNQQEGSPYLTSLGNSDIKN